MHVHALFVRNMDKERFMNLQKFIKKEKPAEQRLKSLRLPRDLSLGGTKIKKQFVPNLTVVRNKDKAKEFIKKTTDPKRRERSRDHKDHKRLNGTQRYVQSTGIFSEGSVSDIKRSHGGWNSVRENDPATYMIKPTIKNNTWQVKKEDEASILDEILKQEGDSEDEKVPFQPVTWNEKVLKDIKVPIKCENIIDNIKKEPGEDSVLEPSLKNLKLEPSNFYSLLKEYQYEEICSNHNPTLTLWSLPDSFAGKGLSEDPNCKQLFDYCLNGMLEGQIGKLIMRKSGRVEVYIGRVKYDLEPTEFESFAEEIVALEAKENQGPSAAVLGKIQNRFLLHPSWDSLII